MGTVQFMTTGPNANHPFGYLSDNPCTSIKGENSTMDSKTR